MDDTELRSTPQLGGTVHKLDRKAIRKWWQDPFVIRKDDVYVNVGIQQLLVSLTSIPIFVYCAYLRHLPLRSLAAGVAVWLLLFGLLLVSFRKHRHQIHSVCVTDDGILLKAPFLERRFRWSEITDFFVVGTVEPTQFLLQTKGAEQFLLSNDLSDIATLSNTITQHIAPPAISFDLSYWIPDGFFDLTRLALTAMFVAIAFPYLLYDHFVPAGDIASFVVMGSFLVIVFAYCWIHLMKTPQLIRAGKSGLLVKQGKESRFVPWEQITGIKRVAGHLWVGTRSGWFVMFDSKGEAVAAKLLEVKQSLPLLSDKRL